MQGRQMRVRRRWVLLILLQSPSSVTADSWRAVANLSTSVWNAKNSTQKGATNTDQLENTVSVLLPFWKVQGPWIRL